MMLEYGLPLTAGGLALVGFVYLWWGSRRLDRMRAEVERSEEEMRLAKLRRQPDLNEAMAEMGERASAFIDNAGRKARPKAHPDPIHRRPRISSGRSIHKSATNG